MTLFHLGAMARVTAPRSGPCELTVNVRVWRPAPVDNFYAGMLAAIEERRR